VPPTGLQVLFHVVSARLLADARGEFGIVGIELELPPAGYGKPD